MLSACSQRGVSIGGVEPPHPTVCTHWIVKLVQITLLIQDKLIQLLQLLKIIENRIGLGGGYTI